MAASAWEMFRVARKHIGNNTISLSATSGYRMALFKAAASTNLSGDTTTFGSIGNEVTYTGNIAAGGVAVGGTQWVQGASVRQYKFSCSNAIFTASGASITSIRFAVIHFSIAAGSGYPLCYAALSTGQFSVSSNNTLTVQANASGIFTLA